MMHTYAGSCQCERVRFEVDLEIGEVTSCNCSRCRRLGALLAFAPASQFRFLAGEDALSTYTFNKHHIRHQFCTTCGVQSFSFGKHPKTGEKMAAVNVRCLEGVDVDALKVRPFDGRSI